MKKILFTLGFLCSLSYIEAMAQDTLIVATPKHTAQTLLEKLDHEVDLSDSQQKLVYAFLLERSEKFAQIQQSRKLKSLSRADFQQANEWALNKLKQVLTPEQFETLKRLRQETQQQRIALREEDIYKSVQDIELDF
jgi:hypothetical protein